MQVNCSNKEVVHRASEYAATFERLLQLNPSNEPSTSNPCLQLAAANGDMRRALETCTAALELKVKEAAAEQADMIESGLASGKQ